MEYAATELSLAQVLHDVQGGLCGEPTHHEGNGASHFRFPCGLMLVERTLQGMVSFAVPLIRFAHDKHHIDCRDHGEGWMVYGDFTKSTEGPVEAMDLHCTPEGTERTPAEILDLYRR